MGQVYRATDTKLRRQVALKILPPSLAADHHRLVRFQREAEVLASLSHPNIAAIYGIEEGGGITALVMELVEGDDLSQRIARGAIPLDEVLLIAKQIAEALEAAHELGIIHRDLKPANIKVRSDGIVKVFDFGLAKAMEPSAGSSPSLSMSPTITTQAMDPGGDDSRHRRVHEPEQARGKTADRRADIWAFGAVLYEMLTGTRAFEGEDIAGTLSNVMKVEPNWQRLPASTPPRVVQVVRACLQKNPKQRMDSAQCVRLALDGAFETEAPQTTTTASAAPRGRLARRPPLTSAPSGNARREPRDPFPGGAVWARMRRSGRALTSLLVAVVVGACVAGLHFLSYVGFENDHFVHLTNAAQMLLGDWPVRDFVDPGLPLMYAVSALGQLAAPYLLLPEEIIVAAAYAVAAGMTVGAVARLSGSMLLGVWAAFVEVVVFPRSYSYPKILLYVIAVALLSGYARRATLSRAAALAVLSAVAFLFRHDHGLYIGAASLLLIVLMEAPRGARNVLRAGATFTLSAALLLAPYAVYLEWHGGVRAYLASGAAFSAVEARRSYLDWPVLPDAPLGSPEVLSVIGFYLCWTLPAVAALVAWLRPSLNPNARGAITAVAVLGLFVNAGFLRDSLAARLPDAVVPFVVLLAWLAGETWRTTGTEPAKGPPGFQRDSLIAHLPEGAVSPIGLLAWLTDEVRRAISLASVLRWGARLVVVLVLVLCAMAAATLGRLPYRLERARVAEGAGAMTARWREVIAALQVPPMDQQPGQRPSALADALMPFFRYVGTCTPPYARILVTGFGPEVPFYAGRGFAGGHATMFGNYYSSEADQFATLEVLRRQFVPLVVFPPGYQQATATGLPMIWAYLEQRYQPMAEFDMHEAEPVKVYVLKALAVDSSYQPAGWPCVW